MTVKELIEELSKIKDQDLDVAVENEETNLWVHGFHIHPTGSSGYEHHGVVDLIAEEE